MKAMIFAAGIGSRLGQITQTIPKCLVEINGAAMLEIVVKRLKNAGVTDVMINIHHFADMVKEYVSKNSSFGINIHFSFEEKLLDTGGGLKRVADFFKSEKYFLVHNSDVYCEFPLTQFIGAHIAGEKIATLGVMKRETERGLYFDSSRNLTGWTQEPDVTGKASGADLFGFTGIQVVSPKLFSYMDESEKFSIIATYLKAARSGEFVAGLDISGSYWKDIGKPNELEALRQYVKKV